MDFVGIENTLGKFGERVEDFNASRQEIRALPSTAHAALVCAGPARYSSGGGAR